VVWIRRPAGGWFPPFDATDDLTDLTYEVKWDAARGDWSAEPLDQAVHTKLSQHSCGAHRRLILDRLTDAEARAEHGLPAAVEVPEGRAAPPPVAAPPEVRVEFVERWRNPRPEQWIKVAVRLAAACPTCGAAPYVWCTYKLDPEQETTDLHVMRQPPKGQEPPPRAGRIGEGR